MSEGGTPLGKLLVREGVENGLFIPGGIIGDIAGLGGWCIIPDGGWG
jgi:hypothetical protein